MNRISPYSLLFSFVLLCLNSGYAQQDSAEDTSLIQIGKDADRVLRQELFEKRYPRSIDSERGGFHQNYAVDWTALPDSEISIVAQARHVWTTSKFAEYSPTDRDAFTAYARHGFAFLRQAFLDKQNGGLYWSVEAEDVPSKNSRGIKHAYGTAFAIYATVSYYELTHDPAALEFASLAFDWLEAHAHDIKNGGYFEQFSSENKPIMGFDPTAEIWQRMDPLGGYFGFKSMNTHIHLLEAFAELAKIDSRPIVRERLREVFLIVRDRIAVEPGVLCLFFTSDWRATAAHDSFGHDIETAYLLIEAAKVLDAAVDQRTWQVARQLVDHALEWGWDPENGGFYDKGEAFSEAFDTDKVWWVQAEGLNVLAVMHLQFGSVTPKYRQALTKQWSFIERFSIDHTNGGWYNETTRQGQPKGSTEKSNAWKCSYHTSRALMNVSRMLAPTNTSNPITK